MAIQRGRRERKYARTTAETRATPPPQTHPHTRLLTPYHRHTLKRTRTHSHENACALTNAQRAHAADRTGAAASHERRSERPEGVRGESRRAHLETTAPPAQTWHCTASRDGAAVAPARRARRAGVAIAVGGVPGTPRPGSPPSRQPSPLQQLTNVGQPRLPQRHETVTARGGQPAAAGGSALRRKTCTRCSPTPR